jgi:hypothetical protein
VWASAEYLLWWVKNGRTPPLVTANGGVVVGGDTEFDVFSGGRVTVGFGVPGFCNLGLESTFFSIGRRTTGFVAGNSGDPVLARPVSNVTTGLEDAQLVSFPGLLQGGVSVSNTSRLWGVEGNLRSRMLCGCNGYLDVLGGFRFLQLDESLLINENLLLLSSTTPTGQPRLVGLPAGTNILVTDSFSTRNQFYGGQLGLDGEYRMNRFFVGGRVKVALGVMHEVVNINGATTFVVAPPVGVVTEQGGLLAQRTNIGTRSSDQFAVVPEVGLRIGYNLNDHVSFFVGYDFLYISNVVRPGDQIDRAVNTTQIPSITNPGGSPLVGSPRPLPLFRHTDYWAQGVNFGVRFKW